METKLYTEKGDAVCQKIDIFKGLMWFAYTNNFAQWHVLKVDQVKEIVALNKEKKRITAIEDYAIETIVEEEKNFQNAVGQDSLTRFDQPKKKKRPNKKRSSAEAEKPKGASERQNKITPERQNKPASEGQNRQNRPAPERQNKIVPEGQSGQNKSASEGQTRNNNRRPKPNRNKPSNDKNDSKQ